MNQPTVRYDHEADALYVQLGPGPSARSSNLGDLRLLDYSAEGSVVAVEFISASEGIDLSGVPERSAVERAIIDSQAPVRIFA